MMDGRQWRLEGILDLLPMAVIIMNIPAAQVEVRRMVGVAILILITVVIRIRAQI